MLQVNGLLCSLPCKLCFGLPPKTFNIDITKDTSGNIVVKTNFGLGILFRRYFLQINIDDNYFGKVCGLCGNFNKIKCDDLTLQDGLITADFNAFGKSWKNSDPK